MHHNNNSYTSEVIITFEVYNTSMPRRIIPLITNNFYHTYNKGINGVNTFSNTNDYNRFLELTNYYRFNKHQMRYSVYLKLDFSDRKEYLKTIDTPENKLINIHSFSLMPNHFHFLCEQLQDKGVQKFISKLINSYTKYFNTKHNRYGQLFLTQFKSKLILENNIFLHICRYIILNTLTSDIVKSIDELKVYPYSSFPDYIEKARTFVCTSKVLENFDSIKSFEDFIADQENYQKELKEIKGLLDM